MTTRIGSDTLRAAAERAVWFDLGPAPLVVARGAQARRFCNGMFTNNVRDLPVGGSNRSALVDDRGRIGGFLDLTCAAEDRFVLVLDGIAPEAFLARYEKYAMLDDVELEERVGARLLTVQGPAIDLTAIGLARGVDEPLVYARVRSPAGGYDVVTTEPDRWRPALGAIARAGDPSEAEALRVMAGRPRFPEDTGDRRLPAEIGLRDELLSFDKGCYLGQESIHRIDVMGDVKRRLVAVRFPAGSVAAAGVALLADGAEVGTLTSPVVLPNGELLGLAVLRRPADEPGTALRAGEAGAVGRAESLPVDPGSGLG